MYVCMYVCPWSAIAFVQALDPWIRWAAQSTTQEPTTPPCQAYMDDVCFIAHKPEDVQDMICIHQFQKMLYYNL